MCIAFPARIIKIDNNKALVELEGIVKEVFLDLIDENVSIGDYVISHAGFAIHRLDEEGARERLDLLKALLETEDLKGT